MLLLGWIAVLAYFAVTATLAVRAARRTRSVAAYAIGTRDIPAAVVGLSLAAQLTSVATFVVNPGLVYAFGLPALLGYGVAAGTGIMLGLSVMSLQFRRHGARVQAMTVPQWIARRFDAPALGLLFAVLSLALVTFATLIVVALALVVGPLLAIPPEAAAIGLLAIVVGTVMFGGATGHAWTNAAQASVMLVVAVVMIGAGLPLVASGAGVFDRLRAIDPHLVGYVNPSSPYFRTVFEVFVCNFVVGIAIVCQPHVISKALYLREDRDVRRFLLTAIACGVVFTAVLVTGFWARLALDAPVRIDRAIPAWIAGHFPPALQLLITIGLLCAGLSTLEGILLALSSIVSIDLFPRLAGAASDRASLLAGRVGLAAAGFVTAGLALWQIEHPTGGTVAIFAQYGVYLVFSTSFVPLACGMFVPSARRADVTASVLVSILVYFGFSIFKVTMLHNNPAFLATAAIVAGWLVIALAVLVRRRQPVPAAVVLLLSIAVPAAGQAPAAPQEKEVRVYGQKIHYLESGVPSGPAVILLHGLAVNSGQWRLTMPTLAGYRVLAPDQLGAGKSDKPFINYRIQTLVDFLAGFYREAGVEKATLVGNSMGGWVALVFALQHPEKVEKLVLVDAAGYSNERWQGPAATRDLLLQLNPSTLAGTREQLLRLFANKMLVNDVTVQAAFTQRLAAGDGHVVNALIDSILRNEDFVDGRLGAIKAPTLVVWGRQDGLLPVAVGETFAKEIPGAKLVVLDNCGHVPHLECFAPFAKALTEFVK